MENKEVSVVFESCVEQGLDKNATIMALANECGLDITKAVREYNKFARDAGLILSVKDRTTKIEEMIAEYSAEQLLDNETRKALVETIVDEFDLSTASATAHVKKYCDSHNIELPSVQRNTLETMIAFVKELNDAGKDRAAIIEGLQTDLGYTANSANSAYSRATRELGISTGGGSVKVALADVVAFIRENLELPKKDAVKQMVEKFGYAESTAASFYTYLNFAREYARQEKEAV